MLEVKDITFSYGLKETLSGISFDVATGEILAVIGANGAGKTTLLRLLACLMMQDSGNIRLDGTDTLERPVRYRRRVGYLSEKCPLYSDMTVEDYLTYRLRLRGERSLRVRRRVDEVVMQCGLIEARGTVMRVLSHGYRKRVGLADALSAHPGVLLLDDPLAGLDLPQRKQVAEVLTSVSARTAVVLAGHEVAQMLGWCTRVLVLRKGRVAGMHRVGSHERGALLARIEQEITGGEGKEGEA
ncbi:MAG: ABC transporter ATP-binding protein [Kiritimatiellaeota bacterium]|nr:ABC transporter ATP-binding protein [Kiritimatiellota bacterium]